MTQNDQVIIVDHKELIHLLQQASAVYRDSEIITRDYENDLLNVPEFLELHCCVLRTEAFKCFDESMQRVGQTWSEVDLYMLTAWLIDRASYIDINTVLSSLQDYINGMPFKAQYIERLTGLSMFSDAVEIDDQVILGSERCIINSELRSDLQLQDVGFGYRSDSQAYLIFEFDHPAQLDFAPGDADGLFDLPTMTQRCEEAVLPSKLCLSLMHKIGLGIQSTGDLTIAPDHVPFLNTPEWGVRRHIVGARHYQHSFTLLRGKNYDQIRNLVNAFKDLSTEKRAKLSLPISRLAACASIDHILDVSSLIELRVALESAYFTKQPNSGITEKLAREISSHSEGAVDKPTAKRVYRLCSKAVHTGEIKNKDPDDHKNVWAVRNALRNYLVRKILPDPKDFTL